MPEVTMQQAAQELHKAVIALTELIEREYPSRREVERRFVSKKKSGQRLAVVLAIIALSSVLSFFTTVTTVSACFLGDTHHPSVCKALPGYSETQERSDKLIAILLRLSERSIKNEKRLDKLEKRK